jgi:hypothetical protein
MSQNVRTRVPSDSTSQLDDVIQRVQSAPTFRPFDDRLVDFGAEFARRLAKRARGHSELQALAFWMRKAELVRMKQDFSRLGGPQAILMARGTVVHFPPANVDTIFIYSWLISLLCGNRSIVRLSSRSTEQTEILIEIICDLARDPIYADVVAATAMVMYPHDDLITSELSGLADLRVIWGGDASVNAIRRAPLAPHATDLTFPSKISLAAFEVETVQRLDTAALAQLAGRFYNDAFWFDQLGCSSPRTIVWVGDPVAAKLVERQFFDALYEVTLAKGLTVEVATAISKITYGFSAPITHSVAAVQRWGNQILLVQDTELARLPDGFVGAGTFHTVTVGSLESIANIIDRQHQTLSYFGFSRPELTALVEVLAGSGLDRLVPVGDALTFNRFWDGNDLFQSFTRFVYLQAS